ncbi:MULTISPECIES: RNA polymerase factor sigma-54 [Deefgea]|uniref:RNA polymerase sigma-54 factor n=1 Tax=Deefgea chitinilytica TaxID=570276 RepID=A0ABS2C8U5_9NEIS|nr:MULTISPECIES: RNA polymerase factor sigma-54 [Deefgea]MBM5570055.1 RNA polymerase factor sigma-54 [Deefgea chitinilytica]MBM9887284.1 RNA polymerase factor sigma-54 [Deefgea sp. CFH1-16]
MKQTLQLRMSQQLNLTPQLQQSIKLLQLSTLDFQQEIEQFLAENPMLEREDGVTDAGEEAAPLEASEVVEEGDSLRWDEVRSGQSFDEDDENDPALRVPKTDSLRDYLLEQSGWLVLPERDRALITLLIDALDDDGLLSQSLDEIYAQIPAELIAELELEPEELQIALQHLQQLEPLGVGARDLAESLSLQLRVLPDNPVRNIAMRLVNEGLDLLAQRDYTRLKRQLQCDEATLREAQTLVRGLTPRPGANWSAETTRYVLPDVIVNKVRGQWQVRLNSAAQPKLRVNEMYAKLLQGDSALGLSGKLQEARWLIKSVEQRGSTILRVAEAIVARQKAFFEYGEVAMRPLVLRDIADELELHESTISRVTTQKYMLTPRGVFEYKYFFGSHVESESGGENSATSIKALIKQLVQQENTHKPLSDSAITEELARQGVVVARRTVAKYREALMIPPVNQRKCL